MQRTREEIYALIKKAKQKAEYKEKQRKEQEAFEKWAKKQEEKRRNEEIIKQEKKQKLKEEQEISERKRAELVKEGQKNKYKKEEFAKFKDKYFKPTTDYKRKLNKFDLMYETAYDFANMRKRNEESKQKLIHHLLVDYYSHKDSLLSKLAFTNKNLSFTKRAKRAKTLATYHRFDEFINKYGNEQINVLIEGMYKNKEKQITLRNLREKLLSGIISEDYFLNRIEYFKDNSPEYDQNVYSKPGTNEDTSKYASKSSLE